MFERELVLVAIDHASDVERTIEVAHSAAKARGAEVHVIRVLPSSARHLDDRFRPWRFESYGDRDVTIRARVASMLRSVDNDGVRVRSITLRGRPEHAIAAYAQLHQATLLVVERGYGSSWFWRSGNVVEEVANRSSVPVLVLPHQEAQTPASRVRRILIPVDFNVASAAALRTAVALSSRHGARITLLHTLENVSRHMVFSGSESGEVVRRLPAQLDAAAKRLRRKAASVGANDINTEVATGVADDAILEIARRSGVDLVVMGIAPRSWFDRILFGSTLRRVLRRATVPVLVVPVVAGAHAWPDEAIVNQVARRVSTSVVDRNAA